MDGAQMMADLGTIGLIVVLVVLIICFAIYRLRDH
jgi:Sec-independent protein translocase protein TatA